MLPDSITSASAVVRIPYGQSRSRSGCERIGRGVNQQSFKQRHGALSRDRAGGGADQAEQGFFSQENFIGHSSFFSEI